MLLTTLVWTLLTMTQSSGKVIVRVVNLQYSQHFNFGLMKGVYTHCLSCLIMVVRKGDIFLGQLIRTV